MKEIKIIKKIKWNTNFSEIKNGEKYNIIIKNDFCNDINAFYNNNYFYIINTVVRYHHNSVSHFQILKNQL